ncbi:MAG TPA: type II toxin-antitoxin system VapC family toxin [Stellaceae bacterium]|nr:type II toxin-antitoxin system VapC family toxin [Stellaceae bacterium]
MSDNGVVADSSAILALLKREPFGAFAPERLFRAAISTVNLSEVLERLYAGGLAEPGASDAVAELSLQVVDFNAQQARSTALLRSRTRHAGLSLGDRACLALGSRLGCPVVTADRAWANVDVGVEIVLIR